MRYYIRPSSPGREKRKGTSTMRNWCRIHRSVFNTWPRSFSMPDCVRSISTWRWVWILATLVGLAALPRLFAAMYYPINPDTVYSGPIVVFTAATLLTWAVLSGVALIFSATTHVRLPTLRGMIWHSLCAGQSAFVALFYVGGALIDRGLTGGSPVDGGDAIFVAALIVLANSIRRVRAMWPERGNRGRTQSL